MIDEKEYAYKVSAAGRVNIIGEHIDYCGGKVFPAALDMCNTVYVRPNGTNTVRLSWTTLPDSVTFDLDRLESYASLKYGNYQAGCAHVWKSAGHKTVGCDMLQDCTVPFGSGLSSSAAIEVSTLAALAVAAGETIDRTELVLLAQKAEQFTGVFGGIMDQYASACGKKGHAMLLDCKTLDCEYVPVHIGEYSLVIANCNKPHSLAESKYNERRAETEEGLRLIGKKAGISCLAELTPSEFEAYGRLLQGKIYDRVRHVVEECERVRQAEIAMKAGDMIALGELLNASHASLRDLYDVTGRELDALSEAARAFPDCAGSRMTGAGFGGCTVSLVKTASAEAFKAYVGKAYTAKTGYTATFYDTVISDGLRITKIES